MKSFLTFHVSRLAFLDCCLDCYFLGSNLPYLQFDAEPNMRVWQVKKALHSEAASYAWKRMFASREPEVASYTIHAAIEDYFRGVHPFKVWHEARFVDKVSEYDAPCQAYFAMVGKVHRYDELSGESVAMMEEMA